MGKFVYCLYTTRSLTVTRKSTATWKWKATRVAIRGANESGYFGGLMIYKFLLNLIKPLHSQEMFSIQMVELTELTGMLLLTTFVKRF